MKYSYQRLWVRAGSSTQDPGDGTSPPQPGIYRESGGYTISGGGAWNNLSGSRVVFVDGNGTIQGNISLANGAFLGIVASGNITVNPTVGNAIAKADPTPADANLTGAFFANGNFTGGTTGAQNDKQLVIYGSVAADAELNGAGRVRFQRDMGVNNRVGPGVAVILVRLWRMEPLPASQLARPALRRPHRLAGGGPINPNQNVDHQSVIT